MARSILGVIVGYLAMAAFVFITFSIAYLAMGTDRAFKPGTYDVSMLWLIVSIVLSIIAAIIGGIVCRLIAPSLTAVYVLAAIALGLGLIMAVSILVADPPQQTQRTADVPNLQAMSQAQTPALAAFINPFIGAAGILVGGMLIDRRRSARAFPVA